MLKSGIAKGDQLSNEQIESIIALEDFARAKQKAYKLLAVRARSVKELQERLHRDDIPAKIAESVIEELKRLGLLNDREFALSFARSRMITRPEGAFLLRRELLEKGVPETFIQAAIEEVYAEKGEFEWAYELACKRKRQVNQDDDLKAQKKVTDFLLRRGFHWDIVRSVIEKWKELEI